MAGNENSSNSSIVIGSSSEIGRWIQEGLKQINYNCITIGRDSSISSFQVSSYDNIKELVFILNLIHREKINIKSIYFCLGSYSKNPISETDPIEWISDININLNYSYIIYRALVQSELANFFDIKLIYLGSTASISRPSCFSSYSISKGALEDLVTYINNEPPLNIRASCLRLGTCKTSFSESSHSNNDIIIREDIINCVTFIESSRHRVLPDLLSIRPINKI